MRKAGLADCIAKVEELERPIKSKGKWCMKIALGTPVATELGPQSHTRRLRYFGTYRHL